MHNEEIIKRDFVDVKQAFPKLELYQKLEGHFYISGDLHFSADYNEVPLEDSFLIEISNLNKYPEFPPTTKEIGGRIPDVLDCHKIGNDILCLGSPLEVQIKFNQNNSLKGYLENLVIPFLYSFCYKEKFLEMPYGELSHGYKGKLESYKGIFNVSSDLIALQLLKVTVFNDHKGHLKCPCMSGKIFRTCHRHIIDQLRQNQTKAFFLNELENCLDAAKKLLPKDNSNLNNSPKAPFEL